MNPGAGKASTGNVTTGRALELTLDDALVAGYPLIYVATWDEERLAAELARAGDSEASLPLWRWTAAEGFREGPGRDRDLRDPEQAIAFAAQEGTQACCLMLDLPAAFRSRPGLARVLRNAYDALADAPGCIVLCHPEVHIPSEMENEIVLAVLEPLDRAEIRTLLGELNDGLDAGEQRPPAWLDACAEVMHGMTTAEIHDLFRHAIRAGAEAGEAEALVRRTRAQRLQKEACLEVIDTRFDLDQVGGLNRLKEWILSRHELFSERARAAGVEPPSGVLMMGVSGCGKSLAAKVIPNCWQLPLIRLDMNRVMSGARGSPEEAWQRALRTAEMAAPVVLWIDEIENSFGYEDGKTVSGNMTIFSSFLTWMQEKPSDVFVVATANRIEMLPAEMLRKGRFDQLFFLDLPDEEARIEILKVHIRAQGGNPDDFDLKHVAGLVNGWTAAEIEQVVRAARTDAFYEDRPFNYDDVMKNSFRMVPLSRTMSEQIEALRRWSHKRATPAD